MNNSAQYKLKLNSLTKNYINTISEMKAEMIEIVSNLTDKDVIMLYQWRIDEIDKILNAFYLLKKSDETKNRLNNLFSEIQLTQSERKIMFYIFYNLTKTEITEKLCISPRTLDKHLEQILYKVQITPFCNFMLSNCNDNAEIVGTFKNSTYTDDKGNKKQLPIKKLNNPYKTLRKLLKGIDF